MMAAAQMLEQKPGGPFTWVREPKTQKQDPIPPFLSKDVHVLSPRTWEYVSIYGKGDFTEVIRVKDPLTESLPWFLWVGPIFQSCGQGSREMTA